jgi:two-component system response regulator FixJ
VLGRNIAVQDRHPVYIVDDDPLIRTWLEAFCEEELLESRSFASGEEFLRALDELEPGCVLLDIRMPRGDGLQVQAELARRGSTLPVIAMSGYGDVDVAVQSMRLGAIEFLEKPFTRAVLKEALDNGFRRLDEGSRS